MRKKSVLLYVCMYVGRLKMLKLKKHCLLLNHATINIFKNPLTLLLKLTKKVKLMHIEVFIGATLFLTDLKVFFLLKMKASI